jgi:hypothetical protein
MVTSLSAADSRSINHSYFPTLMREAGAISRPLFFRIQRAGSASRDSTDSTNGNLKSPPRYF